MVFNGTALRAELGTAIAKELYDHRGDMESDFDAFENENIVSMETEIAEQLSHELYKFISSENK